MTTATVSPGLDARGSTTVRSQVSAKTALSALAGRRFTLSARTPREILVPLLTPILFALVIAPALATMVHTSNGLDYKTYVAVGTTGLLIPLSCMFAGIGVIVDRDSGAHRELLAAPVARPLLVAGNYVVALTVSALQLVALMIAAVARGATFHTIGATPAVAILPWFLAGSLFPIHALPGFLAGFAKVLPLTHALALMRYGLLDRHATGLHDIWGMTNATEMAALSLAVVATWALVLSAASVRVFARAAVR
jgi:ABC-type multidrug transport system permease subunit